MYILDIYYLEDGVQKRVGGVVTFGRILEVLRFWKNDPRYLYHK
jgi:hypothetical protein